MSIHVKNSESALLESEVKISRDRRGIPYIEAANEKDLYFAQGYATASDRLWQMDLLRRTALGRLSEILGPNALGSDKLHRTYGFAQLAASLFERATTRTRLILESYASGVNAFIESCETTSLPAEFQVLHYAPSKWAAVDSLALGKLFSESLSVTIDADILRALLSDLPPEKLEVLLPVTSPLDILIVGNDDAAGRVALSDNVSLRAKFSEFELAALTELLKSLRRAGRDREVGSNSWVVSGVLTASGLPLLANDPHLAPTSPPIWHIVVLRAPELHVCGVALPGLPGIMIGHNNRIAWGITNLCPDVQDLYLEKLDASDPYFYQTPEGQRQVEVRQETVRVRQPSGDLSHETFEVKVTRHGPIILERETLGVALRWTALDSDLIDLEAFLAINSARNWDDFVTALSGFAGPPQNFVYADTDGHIGYYSAGRIPIRKTGDGSVPYDGATDEGDWIGFIPFQELPHAFDPPPGVIVTGNNRLVGRDYPYHLTHNWRVPYRARRMFDLLTSKRGLTVADCLQVQGDTYAYADVIFLSEVLKVAQPLVSSSAEWHEISVAFGGWDGYSNAESKVLPLVTEMRKAFRRQMLVGVMGSARAQLYEWRNESTFIDKLITERPLEWLPPEFTSYEDFLLACYREARNTLTDRLGPDSANWTWGKLASIHFPHVLEKIFSGFAGPTLPQETGGSMPTVNSGARVSMRFVADLGNWDESRLCLPLGESGDLASLHRHDQLAEWRNVNPGVLPFQDHTIAEAAQTILIIRPATEPSQLTNKVAVAL